MPHYGGGLIIGTVNVDGFAYEMTYYVPSGTLNSTYLLTYLLPAMAEWLYTFNKAMSIAAGCSRGLKISRRNDSLCIRDFDVKRRDFI